MSYVRLVNVTKRFGDVTAVDHLNFEIEKGSCFSMLGPSGCGKTTTLRMVAGFEDLSDGEVWVGDRLLSSPKKNHYLPPEKRNFGMVFQAFAVWPHLSVYENVAFPLRIRKLPEEEIKQRSTEALKATNLLSAADQSPDFLSGGGKQRVALARALAINPDVMLLDEPLSSLDPHLREEMRFEIKELQMKYGFSIIYVTHDQAEAMALSDRMLAGWQDGRPVLEGAVLDASFQPPEDLRSEPAISLASRPSEIDFAEEGASDVLRGVVTRKSYLGEIIDYQIRIGEQFLRVQKGRRAPGPNEGENCAVRLLRPFWYSDKD